MGLVYCHKCGRKLPDNYSKKLCEACLFKRKVFWKRVLIVLGVTTGAAVAVYATNNYYNDESYDTDFAQNETGANLEEADKVALPENKHPLLSIDSFLWLYDNWGEEAAQEVLDKVQRGEMSAEQVEKAINRPEIEPEEWRDFEEGWRPDEW